MPDVVELLKKVRKIEIVANRTVNDLLAGQYKSVFRGRGMEFNEVREYEPGDDIRSIDWNVTARAGHPFIKRYVEERELTVLFLVDISASGLFGSNRSKIEGAIEAAATLMFSALKNNDKVGLLTFADAVRQFFPPRKGKANVLRLIRELLACEPASEGTDLCAALEYLNRVLRRRAVVFLMSDFLVPDLMNDADDLEEAEAERRNAPPIANVPKSILQEAGEVSALFGRAYRHRLAHGSLITPTLRALTIASRRHDVVAMRIEDRREKEFPDIGLVTLRDAETGRTIQVDTASPRVRRWLAERRETVGRRIDESLRRTKTDLICVETDSDFVHSLRVFFDRRARSGS